MAKTVTALKQWFYPIAVLTVLKITVCSGAFFIETDMELRHTSVMPSNVLGGELQSCCQSPVTGFYRDGYCRTGPEDRGLHTVCCQVTQPFLDFLSIQGNDLITPRPEYDFPGLTPDDRWCVCVRSWAQAFEAGYACPVVLESCHISVLEFVDLEALKAHAVE